MSGNVFYTLAIRRCDPGYSWFHLPPLNREASAREKIRYRGVEIVFGTEEPIEYSKVGWLVSIRFDYYYPNEESGLLFQHALRDVLFDSDGTGYELDVCIVSHSGAHSEIYRKCRLTDGISFTGGKSMRWRECSINLESRDAQRYSTGSNGSGAPGSGPFEIWSGRGRTITNTGVTNSSGSDSDTTTVTFAGDTSGLVEGDYYYWGTPGTGGEIVRVESVGLGGSVTISRAQQGSIAYPHIAGETLYEFVDPPAGGAAVRDMVSLNWPDTIQAVVDTPTEVENLRTVQIVGGSCRVTAVQIIAGNDAPSGSPGDQTKIRIYNENDDTDYIEAVLDQGDTSGAVATGSIFLEAGDNLVAKPTESAGHGKVQLHITREM